MSFEVIKAIRQNHALEHATVSILIERLGLNIRVMGQSNPTGFYIYGDVPTQAVQEAVAEGLARLRVNIAEEKRLRAFYEKFKNVAPLMDYVQSWGPLAFLRIRFLMSPTYRVLTRDGTPLPSPFGTAVKWEWDLEAYKALNLPVGPIDLD